MNAKDLMIGDWVKVHFGEPNETIGNDMYGPVAELYDDGRIEVAFNDAPSVLWNIEKERGDEILPIPLTTEVLEKNGFKEDFERKGIYWRPDCRKFCIVKELDTWYFAFRVLGETVDKSVGHICISECNYVHKLQHILKDLEIEKEIIL